MSHGRTVGLTRQKIERTTDNEGKKDVLKLALASCVCVGQTFARSVRVSKPTRKREKEKKRQILIRG